MASTLEQFHQHLASAKSLLPVYLLASAEPLLMLEAADALRQRARAFGASEREVFDVEKSFDWNALARASAALSLFSSQRLIELRLPGGKPGTEGAAAIGEYCTRPGDGDVLVIETLEWSKQHGGKWVDAIARVGMVVEIKAVYPSQLPAWIRARAASRKLRLASDALQMLTERVEGNLLAAAQEIDKLALLAGSEVLDAKALQTLVADHGRFDVFVLVEAALAGDALRARRVLAALKAEGEQVAALVGWLNSSLTVLLRLLAVDRTQRESALRNERLFGSRLVAYQRALARGDQTFWEQRLVEVAEVDRVAKGQALGDAFLMMERLLLGIADAGSARALAGAR